MIAQNKFPYYNALEVADAAFLTGVADVSAMQKLLGDLLAKQLVDIYEQAGSGQL